MKGNRLLLVIFVLVVVVLGYYYKKPMFLRITGMKPFVEDRFSGWVRVGVDEKELDIALRRIYDPRGSGKGSWVYELSRVAAKHEEAAAMSEASGDRETAAREYKEASVFYYIARFPFLSSPAKEKAYKNHIKCYLKAAESFNPPIEIVRIPFEGKEIIGYLRVPDVKKPPIVVVSGGVDTWKSDIDGMIEALLAEGLAVLAVDMPGTGESQWKLEAGSDRVYSRALEYMKMRPEIDGNRTGVYLISFSGLFAVKLALVDAGVKAAINAGGPVHLSYTPEHIKKVPEVMIATIAHAMGEDIKAFDLKEIAVKVESFSLKHQGLLKKPERQAALLSINGDKDELVPIDDLYIISKSGIKQEEWVFKGDGHCAPDNMKEYWPRAAKWLKEHM